MTPIKHLFHINAPLDKVFKALSDLEMMAKWYTTGIKGKFQVGEEVSFEFANLTTFKFKIIALKMNHSILFECVESAWDNIGHIMKYELEENEGTIHL